MCASPLRLFRAGPPPPKVALQPDSVFFTRVVPITAGATAAEAGSQVELALEAVSPFPLAQLYYGWFWSPGADHALVFAAYRRRFTTDQTAEWGEAELVLPSFAAVLGVTVEPSTTIVLTSPEGLTAVHWDAPPVPSAVVFRPVSPEASDEERATLRDELLRSLGGTKTIIDIDTPVAADSAQGDRELVFRSGELVSRIPSTVAAALDVRDKGELAALRNARKRDVVLWRVAMACAAGLLLLLIGEFALGGGRQWQGVRLRELNARKPLVDKILGLQEVANRIDDLATKRLLPIEMVTTIVGVNNEVMPGEITFTRVHAEQARGLYTLYVQGQSTNAAQVNVYEAALRNHPACERVENAIEIRGDRATFSMTVTFKPEALKPMQPVDRTASR